MEAHDTIDTVKLKIEEREGCPAQQQRLLYGGKFLNDGQLLLRNNIPRESTLQLLFTLSGGGRKRRTPADQEVEAHPWLPLQEVEAMGDRGELEVILIQTRGVRRESNGGEERKMKCP